MAKIYAQGVTEVLVNSGSNVAKWANISGSQVSIGYARLVGMFYANASASPGGGAVAPSGLVIEQSVDYGRRWDYVSASQSVTASAASVFNFPVYGNAVRVSFYTGNTEAASICNAYFALYPV